LLISPGGVRLRVALAVGDGLAVLVEERSFDSDAREAERLVREDLDPVPLLEGPVELHDLVDVLLGEVLTLLAEALAHLGPRLSSVDELDLAAPFGRLAVGDDPEVGRDAGVVEELIG